MEVDDQRAYHQKLLIQGTSKRKIFGLLERPSFPPTVSQVSYKLYVCGSGKTWARSRLVGQEVCSEVSKEEAVAGIEASVLYWPMKVGGKLILFRLELWEAGEWSVRRYDHVLPACREGVSAVLLCFSVTDQAGWAELPRLLASTAQRSERATVIPLATRIGTCVNNTSDPVKWEVTNAEVEELQKRCGVSVLRMPSPSSCGHSPTFGFSSNMHMSNTANEATATVPSGGTSDNNSGITDEMVAIAPVLNAICTKLWYRDQELMNSK